MKMVNELISYALQHNLIEKEDVIYCSNRLFSLLHYNPCQDDRFAYCDIQDKHIDEILQSFLQYGHEHGLVSHAGNEEDRFDTEIMDVLTPGPSEVIHRFQNSDPKQATDDFYAMQCAVNYIRTGRIAKNIQWKYHSEMYGNLDITINLSKPELDPASIAAAKNHVSTGYPHDLLSDDNVGFTGNAGHPARATLRQIPLTLNGETWLLQYSPYAYFREHCIVLTETIQPMKIDRNTFVSLCDFVDQFPHYFIGSNSDLPICGGSILTHEHFQGGRYTLPLFEAENRTEIHFRGYENIRAYIVNWPLSTIRLITDDRESLISLCTDILHTWQNFDEPDLRIHSHIDGQLSSTITPIIRRDHGSYICHLILRNNLRDEQHPLGVFHARPSLHNIKKENIGLIEAMGLAILPGRLQKQMEALASHLIHNEDILQDPLTSIHAHWVSTWINTETLTENNIMDVLRKHISLAFVEILRDCGVFKEDKAGQNGFLHLITSINDNTSAGH
ncbi:MAG: galactose-1-phosphate uridylyltransferase [Bulleidia sp.]